MTIDKLKFPEAIFMFNLIMNVSRSTRAYHVKSPKGIRLKRNLPQMSCRLWRLNDCSIALNSAPTTKPSGFENFCRPDERNRKQHRMANPFRRHHAHVFSSKMIVIFYSFEQTPTAAFDCFISLFVSRPEMKIYYRRISKWTFAEK